MPKVSVIVPIYNVEKYLKRCIDSILAQTFTEFELILVDDESPDECSEICDDYAKKDSRIKVIHKKNGGVSRARNSGLDIAKGDYVLFCDSDDWWEANLIETAYAALCEKQADAVLFNYMKICGTKMTCPKESAQGFFEFKSEDDKNNYIIKYILGGKHGFEPFLRLYNRNLIEKNNLRFCTECNNFAEDLEFNLKFLLHSENVYCISDKLYNYNMRENSMMGTSKDKIKLNELNEVSYSFGKEYLRLFFGENAEKNFSIIHYLLMYNQYMKAIGTSRYREIPELIKSIEKYDWFIKYTKKLFKADKELRAFLGKTNAQRIRLWLRFVLHRNIKLYELESAIYYRFFYKQ